ncbi:uncharacterized protein LOC113512082 [Galleria mellonella]|uniref:Uncharacterized protein LOC113512082 n=1 Tax=Galleria mellonella TaxID=7137 RepID=A0A6J1WEA9_GALME|nr:uncharacterized protein LOC113512082 [Galleria mellonella]
MSEFSFEGDVNSLSAKQQEFLREVLKDRGYTEGKVVIEAVGKAGDNYVASVKRITVEGRDGSIFKIIAKIAPTQEMMRVQMQAYLLFRNEAVMYSEVLPQFVELQRAEGVPVEDQLQYAECYGILLDEPDEIILLEDLLESDFRMLDRFTSLTNQCIKLSLKNLAILHSLSLVTKKQNPDVFEGYYKKLIDSFKIMIDIPEFKSYLTAMENDAIEIMNNSKYKNAIRGSLSNMLELYGKIIKGDEKLKYSVIIQGDGWTNNIMFKLQDEIPVEAIMIDYQMSRVSNPVCDILYMIFNCTDYETRRAHYHDWIDYYHLQLEESLSNFGIKADFIFSREQLDADLKRYSKLFFGTSVMMSTMLIRKSEDAAKLHDAMKNSTDMEKVVESFQMKDLDNDSLSRFRRRIEGLVDSYRDLGYIA